MNAPRPRVKPSTELALPFALGVAVLACAGGKGVVEAPMMEASASASALALVGERNSPPPVRDVAGELPFKPGDRWVGTYMCRQGKTDMVVLFEDVGVGAVRGDDETDVEAIFEFHFDGKGRAGFAASDGAARMRGKYELRSRRLVLKGEEWIEQPQNYALINLVGTVSPGRGGVPTSYSGLVEGSGCTSFQAHPEAADAKDVPRSLLRPGP
ncbi:MAG: hypothetical protein K0S65_6607 [Labilithrix sp.]|nr:hypothetical protein [Labilithrix sp.]